MQCGDRNTISPDSVNCWFIHRNACWLSRLDPFERSYLSLSVDSRAQLVTKETTPARHEALIAVSHHHSMSAAAAATQSHP